MLIAAAQKELGGTPIELKLEYPAIPEAQAAVPSSLESIRAVGLPVGLKIEAVEVPESQLESELRAGRKFDLAYRVLRCDEPVLEAGPLLCPGYDAPPETDALASAASPRILQLLLQLERAAELATARGLAHPDRPRVARRAAGAAALAGGRPLRLADPAEGPGRGRRPALPGHRIVGDHAVDRQGPWTMQMSLRSARASRLGSSIARPRGAACIGVRRWPCRSASCRPWQLALPQDCRCRDRPAPGSTARRRRQRPRRRPPPPSRSTGSRIGSSSTSRSIPRPGSTRPGGRTCSGNGRRSCIGSSGPPWSVTIAGRPSPLASGNLDALEAAAFAKFDPSFDKIWLVRISAGAGTSGLLFTGREYDTATRTLGPFQQHKATVLADAPRALLQFTRELFNPTAVITGQEGGRALLQVRGAAIPPASRARARSSPRGRSSSRSAWST